MLETFHKMFPLYYISSIWWKLVFTSKPLHVAKTEHAWGIEVSSWNIFLSASFYYLLFDCKFCLQTENTLENVKKVDNFLRKWQISPLNNYKITNSWNKKLLWFFHFMHVTEYLHVSKNHALQFFLITTNKTKQKNFFTFL